MPESPPLSEPPPGPDKRFWLVQLIGGLGNAIRWKIKFGIKLERVPESSADVADINNLEHLREQLIEAGSLPQRADKIVEVLRRAGSTPQIEPPEEETDSGPGE